MGIKALHTKLLSLQYAFEGFNSKDGIVSALRGAGIPTGELSEKQLKEEA